MIVILSNDDLTINAAKRWCEFYKEKSVYLKENCFHSLKKDEPVIFLGHAYQKFYGDNKLNPNDFLKKLEEFKFPFEKARQLYLCGCEIGEGLNNYMYQFADALYSKKDNHHLQVYGLIGLSRSELLQDMTIYPPGDDLEKTLISSVKPAYMSQVIEHQNKHKEAKKQFSEQIDEMWKKASDQFVEISKLWVEFEKKQVSKPLPDEASYQLEVQEYYLALLRFKDQLVMHKYNANFKSSIDSIKKYCDELDMTTYPPKPDNLRFLRTYVPQLLAEIKKGKLETFRLMAEQEKKEANQFYKFETIHTNLLRAIDQDPVNHVNHERLSFLKQFDENRFRVWGLANASKLYWKQYSPPPPKFGLFSTNAKINYRGAAQFWGKLINEIENPKMPLDEIIKSIQRNKSFIEQPEDSKQLQLILQNILQEKKKEHKETKPEIKQLHSTTSTSNSTDQDVKPRFS